MISNKQFNSTKLHELTYSEFDIYATNTILLVENLKLIQYNLDNLNIMQSTPLEMPMKAIAAHPNSSNLFAIGGNKVELYDQVEMISPKLVASLNGDAQFLKFSQNGKYLGISSEENELTIYNKENGRVSKCRPGHEGMGLSCEFDPKDRFVGSIGCDGQLIIYQLCEPPQMLSKYSISKSISPDGSQRMKSSWHPSGDFITLPGQLNLQYVMTEDECQDLQISYQVMHEQNICIVEWVKENFLLTGGEDSMIKFWHFKSFLDISICWKININTTPISLKQFKDSLYILDNKGYFHSTKLEFPSQTQQIVQDKSEKPKQDKLDQKKLNMQSNKIEEERQQQIDNSDKESIQSISIPVQKNKVEQQEEYFQDVVRPGETNFTKGRRYLFFNHIGTIIECKTTKVIEFEFFDSLFYRKFRLENNENFSLGSMNYRGCVVACKGPNEVGKEGYAENEKSVIYFEQFNQDRDSCQVELDEEEGAELVCIGNDWFAVWSDYGIVRIFGFYGIEILQFQTNRPLVSMCAYENQLCLIYHDSAPLLQNQNLKAKIYDVENGYLLNEIDIFITPFSTLKWIGYSEEGMLSTQDTKGFVRVFQNNRWIEVMKDKSLWVFGISDYKIECIKDEPLAVGKPLIVTKEFQIPTVHCYKDEEKIMKLVQQIEIETLILNQENYRWKYFGYYHNSRNQNDALYRYCNSLYDSSQLEELEQKIKKHRIELFTQLLAKSIDKGIEYFKININNEQEMNNIIGLLEKKAEKNEQVAKCVQQLKSIQRGKILKKQDIIVAQKTHSPKRQGFGLQRQVQVKTLQSSVEQLLIEKQLESIEEEGNDNPFATSGKKNLMNIFDMNDNKKRRVQSTFGSQNMKKKI